MDTLKMEVEPVQNASNQTELTSWERPRTSTEILGFIARREAEFNMSWDDVELAA